MRITLLLILLVALSNSVLASVITSTETANEWKHLQSGGDMLVLSPVNASGISVNVFDNFEIDTPIQLLSASDAVYNSNSAEIKLIVIKANSLKLKSALSLVSSISADILFINESDTGVVVCENCSMENFKRISFAVASADNSIAPTLSKIDVLAIKPEGVISINGFSANGSISVDFYANDVITAGHITTMETGDVDPRGGYRLSKNGKLKVASSGINFYLGQMSVSFTNGKVISTSKNSKNENDPVNFQANISAAGISVVSARSVIINKGSEFSTLSDIVMTNTYRGVLFVPIEGVNIMTLVNTNQYGKLNIEGTLLTDNEANLVSADDISVSGTIISNKLTIVAQQNLVNTGYLDVRERLEGSASIISNRGQINSSLLDLEAEDSLFNHFGGRILANEVNLVAKNLVINGSRKAQQPELATPIDLIINDNLSASFNYGLYNVNNFTTNSSGVTDVSAHIVANKVFINSGSFENINPYFRERASVEIWDGIIDFEYQKTKQVKLLAEEILNIVANKYVINSSAVMGLEQNGDFTVNTPKLLNERYRVNTSGYKFARKRQNSQNETHTSLNSQYEAHVDAFSPMGVIYSYGDLNYSPLTAGSATTFVNHMSYLQVHGISNFFNTELSSLGMMTGTGEVNPSVTSDTCLIQHCSGAVFTDSFIRTTFTSFLNDVYGLSTDFLTSTEVQVQAQEQALVDAYIADYIAANTKTFPTDDPAERSQRFDVKIETISNNRLLVITEYICQQYYNKSDAAFDRMCSSDKHTIYVFNIMAEYSKNLIIPGTEQTDAQIRSMAQTYLDKDTYRSVEIYMDNSNPYEPMDIKVHGFWIKTFTRYLVIDSQNIQLFYRKKFFTSYNRDSGSISVGYNQDAGAEYSVTVPYSTFKTTMPKTPESLSVSYNSATGSLTFDWADVYYRQRTFDISYKAPSSAGEVVKTTSALTYPITFANDGTVQFKARSCVNYPDNDGNNASLCSDWSSWYSKTVDYTEPVEPPECRFNCCTGRNCPIEP